jgi:DNA-binding NarL/FixJ family response regulator
MEAIRPDVAAGNASVPKTIATTTQTILATARNLRAELHQAVLQMVVHRAELHERASDLKARREAISKVAQSIAAELREDRHKLGISERPRRDGAGEVDRIFRLLSARQRRVLEGVLAGHANKRIAFDLGVSTKTIETHRARVMAKFHAASLAELVRTCAADARFSERPSVSRRSESA